MILSLRRFWRHYVPLRHALIMGETENAFKLGVRQRNDVREVSAENNSPIFAALRNYRGPPPVRDDGLVAHCPAYSDNAVAMVAAWTRGRDTSMLP